MAIAAIPVNASGYPGLEEVLQRSEKLFNEEIGPYVKQAFMISALCRISIKRSIESGDLDQERTALPHVFKHFSFKRLKIGISGHSCSLVNLRFVKIMLRRFRVVQAVILEYKKADPDYRKLTCHILKLEAQYEKLPANISEVETSINLILEEQEKLKLCLGRDDIVSRVSVLYQTARAWYAKQRNRRAVQKFGLLKPLSFVSAKPQLGSVSAWYKNIGRYLSEVRKQEKAIISLHPSANTSLAFNLSPLQVIEDEFRSYPPLDASKKKGVTLAEEKKPKKKRSRR